MFFDNIFSWITSFHSKIQFPGVYCSIFVFQPGKKSLPSWGQKTHTAHRMQVKFVFHTMSTEMCFLIISSVELQVFTLKFTSQGFIAEFLYFDLVKNDCQVEGRKSIRPTECRSTFCYLSWHGKVYLGQLFGWVHYLKLPWSVWCNNCSVYSLTMPNLQNLGYTAHKMQVS